MPKDVRWFALLAPALAWADEPAPAPSPEELAARIEALEVRADKVEVLEDRIAAMQDKLEKLAPLRRYITVFIDAGWFSAGGDGAGVRPDIGHRYVHDYNGVPADWVLIGDPLSTTVNSLGEPADIGASRSIEEDTIDSDGTPAFILNSVGLSISRAVRDDIAIAGLIEFLPRSGEDILSVENAHVDYRPGGDPRLVLSVGKIDSVLGIEYRAQDAPDRVGITPSLLCRYTCGRPVGVRAHYTHQALDLSALVANGDAFQQRFQADPQLASTKLPTVSAHAQYALPVANGVKVGISGAFGPQDGQDTLRVHQWHYGFDLFVHPIDGFELQAEFVQGRQQGSSTGAARMQAAMPAELVTDPRCSEAPCLDYKAAYGVATYRVKRWTPYARIDWRDARHQHGVDFLYVSRLVRGTVGARFAWSPRILGKIEYTYNHELVGPQFPNDVLTTSIVISTGD